jgi:hypothetical protein
MAPRSVRFGVRSRKLSSNVGQSLDGRPKIYYYELHSTSEGTLSRWSRLYLQSLVPARVVVYGPFSLCVIISKACAPSSSSSAY